MRLPALLIVVVAALTLIGCSAPTEQRTAEQVMRDLTVRVEPAAPGVVFTAETDPNDLLGRPGGYTSKASFIDDRIDPEEVIDPGPGSVDIGGSIEVFDDADAAGRRADYIGKISQALPALTEYDYVSGRVLLRVSGELTPQQAAAYEAALSEIG